MSYLSHANYLVVPQAASESWEYLPICFTNKIHAGNYWSILPETHLYQFGVMNSSMHMSWLKCVSGKLQCYDHAHYNPTIKNFPWPISHTQSHIMAIEAKALTVLQIRAQYQDKPLDELYHPATMPVALRNAHIELDKAVDAAYSPYVFASDDSRIGFLLNFQRKIASFMVTLSEKPAPMPKSTNYALAAAKIVARASAGTLN